MWMKPTEQEDEDEFAALVEQLAGEPLPNQEAAPEMPSADLATPMEPETQPAALPEEPARDTLYPNVDPLPAAEPEDIDRPVYPDAAPSDMGVEFYHRLALDRQQADDSEGADYASERLERYAAGPQQSSMPGESPMWEKYSNQGARMGTGGGAGLSALASRGYGGGSGGPPMAQDNSLLFGLAALADFGLNKGRHTGRLLGAMGQDTDYENYRRQMEHQKDMAGMQALANRGRYGGRGMSPEQLALRQQQIAQRDRQLAISEAAEARKMQAWEEANSPDSGASARAREIAIASGLPAEVVQGQSAAQLAKLSPAVNDYLKNTGEIGEARTDRAAATAGAQARATMAPKIATAAGISDATQANKLELVREGAQLRNEAERQSPAHEMAREKMAADQAFAFTNASERYLNIGDAIAPVRAHLEMYKGKDDPAFGTADSAVPDRFTDEESLRVRQNLRNAAEQVLRANTGAAAPITEAEANDLRTGASPGATEKQVRVATEIVDRFARNNIRSFATNREDAARAVLRNRGLEQWAYPETAQEPTARPIVKPRPAGRPQTVTVDDLEDAPAPSGGPKAAAQPAQPRMRNGKPVRKVLRAYAPDGRLVRVVLYEDGTQEQVVQ